MGQFKYDLPYLVILAVLVAAVVVVGIVTA